jgi:hypothetical protein
MNDVDAVTLQLFNCVFPNGLGTEDMYPLMYLLKDDMSFRSVASIVGALINQDYTLLLTSAYHAAGSSYRPDPAAVAEIRDKLSKCGYDEWLNR